MGSRDADLAITGGECHPGGRRPPGDHETEEPGVVGTGAFGSPYVDRPTEGQGRAYLCQDGSSDTHEHEGDDVRRPGAD